MNKRRNSKSNDSGKFTKNQDKRSYQSHDKGSDGLVRNRVAFTAQLPFGRPWPKAQQKSDETIESPYNKLVNVGGWGTTDATSPNYVSDWTGLTRAAAHRFVFGAMFTRLLNDDSGSYSWFNRVAQHIYNRLRDEVRSNTTYTVDDVKKYLVHAMYSYAYGVILKRKLQTASLYDVRAPGLWMHFLVGEGKFETSSRIIKRESFTNGELAPAFTTELGDAWLASTKVHSALSYFVLPSAVKAHLDRLLTNLMVVDDDGQYATIDLDKGSFMYYDGSDFVQYADASNPAAITFSAGGIGQAAVNMGLIIQGSVQMGTLIADMRRLQGMERLVVAMPPTMGTPPEKVRDNTVSTMLINAYDYSTKELGAMIANQGTDVAPLPLSAREVRVQGLIDLQVPTNVGAALFLCNVSNDVNDTIDNFGHAMFEYRFTLRVAYDEPASGFELGTLIFVPALVDIHESLLRYGTTSTEWNRFTGTLQIAGAVLNSGVAMVAAADLIAPCIYYCRNGVASDVDAVIGNSEYSAPYSPSFCVFTKTLPGTRVSKEAVNDIIDAYHEYIFTVR